MTVKHPAVYNDKFIPLFAELVRGARKILDLFAGSGKIFSILDYLDYTPEIVAIEIEPEFAAMDSRTKVGDALNNGYPDGYY